MVNRTVKVWMMELNEYNDHYNTKKKVVASGVTKVKIMLPSL